MNTYTMTLTALDGTQESETKNFLSKIAQVMAHASIFGQNLTMQRIQGPGKGLYNAALAISFELPYSLSPVIGGDATFGPTRTDEMMSTIIMSVYDSSCQGTREYVDRPYPRAGNMVSFLAIDGDTGYRKDLDNFIKIPAIALDFSSIDNNTPKNYDVIIGVVNSGLSDFYEPLKNYTHFMEIVDVSRTEAIQAGNAVSNLNAALREVIPQSTVADYKRQDKVLALNSTVPSVLSTLKLS